LPSDFDLDLGLGQGHISMHNTYMTTSIHDQVTLASSNTEIWLFESPVISTFIQIQIQIKIYIAPNSLIKRDRGAEI